jgi:4-aminobutyrate aminotransferase-like enzyme
MGMIVGIEIVVDKESRKPAPEAADLLAFKYDINVVFISSTIETRNLYLRLPIYWLLSMILM